MVDATVNSNVGVNINPSGMEAAAAKVRDQVRNIAREIEKAGRAANDQLKAMAIGLKQVQTLQNYKAQDRLGGFGTVQGLGRQARAMAEYRAGISKTSDAMGVLRGRMVALDVANGKLIQSGRLPSKGSLMNAQNIEQTATAYGKVTNQVGTLRGRIALLGDDSRKAFAPMLRNLEQLDQKNARIFSKSNQYSFRPQLQQMERNTAALAQQVGLAEKAEKAERLKLQTLREEGRQILTNNQLQREAALGAAVRTGQGRIRNLELIGGTLYQRETNQMERLRRATLLTTQVKRQLDVEMAKPSPGAARLNVLIERYRALQREIGQTIALKNREQASQAQSQGGFFAGLRHSRQNLFGSEGETGMFGAGALVGRVAAYAVAAGAIYGLISAIRQGITFAIQFEDALAQLKAVSGSTSAEMDRLSAGILDVSRNSANSVMELTKSATIIAQAGYAGNEIQQLLQNVVNLSAASGATTDESVDILTSALGSFQLAASEATTVTDALVASLNDSKLSVNQVQLGLQYVGATARLNNITFNELVSTLGAMADAGIRSGSTMSTGLRQMLVDFIDPSEKLLGQLKKIGLSTADIDVKTLGLVEVLTRLRDAGFQGYGALETRAAAAYAVLSGNIPQIQKLEEATLRQNAAQDAAADRLDSVSAKWQRMLNVFSAIGAEIGEGLSPALKALIDIFTILGGVILVPLAAVAKLIGAVFSLGQASDNTAVSVEDFEAALRESGYSAEEAAARAQELKGSLGDVETALKDTAAEMDELKTQQSSLRAETEKLILREEDLSGKNGDLSETTAQVSHQVNVLAARFPNLREEFRKTEGGIAGLIQAMIALDRKAQETLVNLARVARDKALAAKRSALNQGGDLTKAFRSDSLLSAYRSPVGRSDPLASKARQFESLMKQNNVTAARQAQRLLEQNPQLAARYPNVAPQLNRVISNYDQANTRYEQYNSEVETGQFALSETGQQIIGGMSRDTAASERAASQGYVMVGGKRVSKEEVSRGLNSRIEWLAGLEKSLQDNPHAMGLLNAARANTNAALARLAPEEDSKAAKAAERAAAKAAREAKRRGKELARIDSRIQKEQVEYEKQLYENSLEVFDNAPTLDEIPDLLDTVSENLATWLGGEAELAVDSIEAMNPTTAQREKMMATAGRKIEELRIEQIDKTAGILAKVIKDFMDRSLDAIESQFEEAMRFTERNLKIAQARVQGLGNPLARGNTPEYMKTVEQRKADVAAQRNDFAMMDANARRIQQLTELAERVRQEKGDIEARIANLGSLKTGNYTGDMIIVEGQLIGAKRELRGIDTELDNIDKQTRDLILTNDALRASYEVLNEIPRTFGEGLRMAIEAVKIDIGAADNLGQELIKNLDQPLRALHESFKGFFSDIISGTVTLGQAFKNMAGTIIDAILEMVAVALANQFFSLLANIFAPGGGIGGGANTAPGFGTILPSHSFGYRGGQIGGLPTRQGIPNMYGGGQIDRGMVTRDSTLVHAAKEEYLIRRPAAQSLGKGFLDAINARGVHALDGMGGAPAVAVQAPPVQTNVYIIAPEEKPTMGPNDVIATFSNDVLKGGVTKKLIKQVASGG